MTGCQAGEVETTSTASPFPANNAQPTSTPIPTPTTTPTPIPEPTATFTPEEVEKPLYSECGDPGKTNIIRGAPGWDVIGVDGRPLPTGRFGVEHNIGSGVVTADARACLTEVEGFTDPNFPSDAIRAKVVFYDTDGKPHEYPIMLGGTPDNGAQKKVGLCDAGSCTIYSISDALEALEGFFANENVTKQISINYMLRNNGPASPISEVIKLVNLHADFLLQLDEALRTGTNFPEAPEGFFLWINQIHY